MGTAAGHIALPLVTHGAIRCPRGLKTIAVLESKLSDEQRKQSSQRSDSRLKMLRAVGFCLPTKWNGWRASTLHRTKSLSRPTVLQNLSKNIRECYRRAEECRRKAKAALNELSKANYLEMALAVSGPQL